MKKLLLTITLAILTFFNVNIFAATGETQNDSSAKADFSVAEVKVADDKNIDFIFSAPLAEEPVEIRIIKLSDDSEIGIEETKVDQDRTKVIVKLIDGLEKGEDYGYYVASALSEGGDKLNQTDKDMEDMEIPSGIVLPDDASEDASDSLKDAFADVKANPETAGETVTEKLDAAPASSADIISDPINQSSQNGIQPQNDILIQNSKQLPKTGPAENLIILTALAIGASIIYFRKNGIRG